jgi:predicted dehydrogenase
MRATRVGIVGAGAVGARHARVLASLTGVEVAAVADRDPARAHAVAADHGARVCAGHDDLLKVPDLAAVYVCVPPFAHGEVERAILEAGLPLFVEKPLAADLETAEQLAEAVERAGVVTATGYHWRHLDTLALARSLLAERPARLLQAAWVGRQPDPPWWSRRSGSGGQVVEQATHVVDVLRVLGGEVTAVEARAISADRPDSIDLAAVASLRFSNGAVGTVTCSCLASSLHRARVEAVADGLVLQVSETELTVTDAAGSWTRAAGVDPRLEVDRAFIAALRGEHEPNLVPYAEALRTHRLACAVQRSADEGRAMALA